MAIQEKRKGATPADRKKQIEEANKRTAAKIAKKRAVDASKKKAASSLPKMSTSGPMAKGMGGSPLSGGAVKQKTRFIAEHTVKKGDTLSAIAKKYYGSGAKPYYELIFEANKDIIKDVNLIYPDQVFKIPPLPPGLKK